MTVVLRRPRVWGSWLFLAGTVLVHAGNYAYNLAAARLLTPAEYSDVALAVTGLLLVGFVTVAFQTATARTVAGGIDDEELRAGLARWFSRRAFQTGLVIAVFLAASAPALELRFRTGSIAPFIGVALALPWAFQLGARRGWAQGSGRFGSLTASFQVEMAVRILFGIGAVVVGLGAAGAIGGLTASVIASVVVLRPGAHGAITPDLAARRRILAALIPSLALLAGEGLMNHVDTVVVKQAFTPDQAGRFAAVALLGRSVFFLTWPVSVLLFPAAAEKASRGESVGRLTAFGVGVVAAAGLLATAVGFAVPEWVIGLALGEGYVGEAGILGPYLLATTLFACSATLASLKLATGDNMAGYAALAAGTVVTGALAVHHTSVEVVVWIQVVLMAAYLVAAAIWTLSGGAQER